MYILSEEKVQLKTYIQYFHEKMILIFADRTFKVDKEKLHELVEIGFVKKWAKKVLAVSRLFDILYFDI